MFSRQRQEKRLDEQGEVRVRRVDVPIEEWSVCLPDHHPGYVSWEEYLATRARLKANVRPRGEGGGAAREGTALLQGLVRCGRCGRKMQVAYSGSNGKVGRHACVPGRDMHATGQACQTLGAGRLDKAVAAAFLDAVARPGSPRPPARSASSKISTRRAWPASAATRNAKRSPGSRATSRACGQRAHDHRP